MKFLYVIFVYLSLAYRVFYVNKKDTKKLIKELDEVLKKEGHSLSEELKKRIELYTVTSSIANQWFCGLTGKKETKRERKCTLYLGAVTPIFDDVQDTLKVKSVEILKVLDESDDLEPVTAILLKYLYNNILAHADDGFERYVQDILEAQDDSLQQIGERRLTDDEIRAIDYKKGGGSVMLQRMVISAPLKKGEREAIYDLGYLIQEADNMFDMYDDYEDNVQTLYTNSTDFEKADVAFRKMYRATNLKFLKLGYDYKNVERFLCEVATALTRGLICSEQHIVCQKKYNGFIDIGKVDKNELICDMEKPLNIIKSIKYTIDVLGEIKELQKSLSKG